MSGLGLGDTGEVERATVLFVQRATWTLGSRIAQQKHNPWWMCVSAASSDVRVSRNVHDVLRL